MGLLINRKTKAAAMALVLAVLMLTYTPSNAWAALTVKANHDDVKIGYNYHGSTVSIGGISDPGVDLILKISSDNASEKMRRKDKVAGFLWMNVEELHLENVPAVYFLRSTKDPAQLLDAAKLTANGIGYEAITQNAEISPLPDPNRKNALFADFIKYQESKNKFSQSVGGIELTPHPEGQAYQTLFDWPYQVSPGDYQVTAYAVKDGDVVDTAQTNVTVENAGEVKALHDLASNNGALYGIAAIMVAIAAGFGVGMVFRSGGAH
jgi:hypothetical protein